VNAKEHWENIYNAKPADAVSWYSPHLEKSLLFIKRVANQQSSIIDIGAGASTLVDDLLVAGYQDLTALDISQTALDRVKDRLGQKDQKVKYVVADITSDSLPPDAYDVWHDRAVFHFLTKKDRRIAYIHNVLNSVKEGGHVLISTFAPDGPTKCSGLDVVRYDGESLHQEFGPKFDLLESSREIHQTPFGTTQNFFYCLFALKR
jgi:SAM-dependent methyltransferase